MKKINPFCEINTKNPFVKFFALVLSLIIKNLKNIFPPKFEINYKLHRLQKYINLFTHNYMTVPQYCEFKKIPVESRKTDVGNIYTLKDFYVDVYRFSSIIHDNKNNVMLESINYSNDVMDMCSDGIRLKKSKNIKYVDEAVDLALLWAHNYWHFTFQVIDKITCFEKLGYKGKYLVFDKPFIRQILMMLDIPEERIVFVNNKEKYKIGKLHVIEDFWKTNVNLLTDAKREIIGKIDFSQAANYPKKLYIRRIGNYVRQITNENEIVEMLEKFGFEVIYPDNHSVEEQIKYFNMADVVVCPHGGGGTNALYMKAGSHFVECFSYTWLRPCLISIIKPNNMHYHMIAEAETPDLHSVIGRGRGRNYHIDKDLLESTIYKFV